MNKDEVLNFLAMLVLYKRGQTILVALNSVEDIKVFKQAMLDKFSEVPSWLMPSRRENFRHRVSFDNYMTIMFVHSEFGCKGITPSIIIADDRLPTINPEWDQFTTFLALAVAGNPVTYFKNDS